MFHLCYLDESGCLGSLPSINSPIQPVFALIGLIVPTDRLKSLTYKFINLKRTFNPQTVSNTSYLDSIQFEIKGGDLRQDLRSSNRAKRRRAFTFLDNVLSLLEQQEVRLVGRVWVKPIGGPFKGREIYTSSVQSIAHNFHQFLTDVDSQGVIVCDSRNNHLNAQVAHSVFTQKFSTRKQDYLSRLQDLPFFADSRNHAGIQLIDLVCSAIVSPLAATVYCNTNSNYTHANYLELRRHFGKRLRNMQYRTTDNSGISHGGLVVSDPNGKKHGGRLFAD